MLHHLAGVNIQVANFAIYDNCHPQKDRSQYLSVSPTSKFRYVVINVVWCDGEILKENRRSYMSVHVLFYLSNELRKRDKTQGLSSIVSLFRNVFTIK